MAIKASGHPLRAVSERHGFVMVDYPSIKRYFAREKHLHFSLRKERETTQFILSTIVSDRSLRPSIETGFHAFLDRVVIHTHSIYVNALACTVGGRKAIQSIFSSWDLPVLWIPYRNPGYQLSYAISKKVSRYRKRYGTNPEVLILKNHGVIISHNNWERALDLLLVVDRSVLQFIRKKSPLPIPRYQKPKNPKKVKGGIWVASRFLNRILNPVMVHPRWLRKFIFPDQVVYCDRMIRSFEDHFPTRVSNAICIGTNGILYPSIDKINDLHEVFQATLMIFWFIHSLGMHPSFLKTRDVNYIRNMESEDYRRSLSL